LISLLYCQMAAYIENDVQNALTDICNGGTLASASTRYRI